MEGKISFQKDPNSTFDEDSLGTPPTKRDRNHKFIIYDELKNYHATFLSTMLIFASMLIFSSSNFGSCLFSSQCSFLQEYGTLRILFTAISRNTSMIYRLTKVSIFVPNCISAKLLEHPVFPQSGLSTL